MFARIDDAPSGQVTRIVGGREAFRGSSGEEVPSARTLSIRCIRHLPILVRGNYVKRFITAVSVAALAATALSGAVAAQDDMEKPNIAFLPGILDPFYQVMEQGILKAVKISASTSRWRSTPTRGALRRRTRSSTC